MLILLCFQILFQNSHKTISTEIPIAANSVSPYLTEVPLLFLNILELDCLDFTFKLYSGFLKNRFSTNWSLVIFFLNPLLNFSDI